MNTVIVMQKNAKGRKSMEVGTFQTTSKDAIHVREDMYRWLHDQGISIDGYKKYFPKIG